MVVGSRAKVNRKYTGISFKRGEEVVVRDYDPDDDTYLIENPDDDDIWSWVKVVEFDVIPKKFKIKSKLKKKLTRWI